MKKVYIISCNKNVIAVYTNRAKAIEQIELITSRIEAGKYYVLSEEEKARKTWFYCEWETINKQNEPDTIERFTVHCEDKSTPLHKIAKYELKQYEVNAFFY